MGQKENEGFDHSPQKQRSMFTKYVQRVDKETTSQFVDSQDESRSDPLLHDGV